jgi:hypothetical protein
MFFIILTTIVITSVGFHFVTSEVDLLLKDLINNLYREKRYIDFVQLASNTRSLINVANELEYTVFDNEALNQHGA